MSEIVLNNVRKGFYLDSVALMRMSRVVAKMPGVNEAALMMGTPSNLGIMADAGLLADEGRTAGGGDLIIGIRAATNAAADAALAEAHTQLEQPTASVGESKVWHPRTLRAALKSAPGSNLALISVPGDFAIAEARKAIRQGLNAMIFSDNVSVADEAALKREAAELGRLVMGPDCGTAIINGTPLAFANVVPRGEIGLVGASGTGTQEISCLVAQYGAGISHAIGVGGRDLNSEVGGISTLMALDALDADPATKKVVLISKPPPADVAANILNRVSTIDKPVIVCFIGADEMPVPANATQVFNLKAAACAAAGLATNDKAEPKTQISPPANRTMIQGLFSGGTLCAEAQVLLRAGGRSVRSNAPIPGVPSMNESGSGHAMLDLGDDEYTQGKPHPMIDPSVRDGAIATALMDDRIGIVLLDVVIGFGAHADPAGHLANCLSKHARPSGPEIIASVTGTEEDPQVRSAQVKKLIAAGVHVAPTNADASVWALSAIQN
ncbi:MAG: acyl-CoA synthetase FdrA [Hyphomicrobiaceae bacterium]